jgi:DNA repair exonuclease SbcCD ATPase subunit
VHSEQLEARVKELEALLNAAQETPERLAERKNPQIKELEQQYKRVDEEDKELQKVQEEKEQTLKALQGQLRANEGPAAAFTIKPVKAKKKKGKKVKKEQDSE